MGKQRAKRKPDPIKSVNATDWEKVARDLYRKGLISAASLEDSPKHHHRYHYETETR